MLARHIYFTSKTPFYSLLIFFFFQFPSKWFTLKKEKDLLKNKYLGEHFWNKKEKMGIREKRVVVFSGISFILIYF